MLDHILLTVSNTVSNIERSLAFYEWLKQGAPDPASIHWGFKAEDNAQVDDFYRAATAVGTKDNISPRARIEYSPGYYAAGLHIFPLRIVG
jgi:hypothetical protein